MKVLSRQFLIMALILISTAQKCGDEKLVFLPETDIPTLERAEYIEAGPLVYDLTTDQDKKIGEIIVWNNDERLFVKYTIENEDMCLTATQLHVSGSVEEIPIDDEGNPSPQQYEYQGEHNCETEMVHEIDLRSNGWECGNQVQISAHAVVSTQRKCDTESLLFGAKSNTGAFYSIDLTDAIATLLFDVEALTQDETKLPAGLAYNENTQRLYFAIYDQQKIDSCALFYFDGTNVKEAGFIEGNITGATFFEGKYYFINDATNNLNRASFDENGKVTSIETLCTEFHANNSGLGFSDIAISYDGASFYGIANPGNNKAALYTIDFMSCENSPTLLDSIKGRHLAFGSNGILYGYNQENKEFYELNPDAETISNTETVINIEQEFQSLASGQSCIPQEEEVWSSGETFQGSNTGTRFTFEVTCNDACGNWESAIAWGGPNEGDGTPEWFYLDGNDEKPQQLYTSKGPIQGSKIYYIDGKLSIETGPSVILKQQTETVRINGYYEYTLPDERPDTEAFETIRDNDYSLQNMNVGYYDYLVVWMDVWICRE